MPVFEFQDSSKSSDMFKRFRCLNFQLVQTSVKWKLTDCSKNSSLSLNRFTITYLPSKLAKLSLAQRTQNSLTDYSSTCITINSKNTAYFEDK